MKKITKLSAILLFLVLVTSCVSSTRVVINSNVEGATVYIDGVEVGTTPVEVQLSNAIWEDPDIVLKKEGYHDLQTHLYKETKSTNLICGLLLFWPSLLYVQGPKPIQNFILNKQ